MLEEGAEAEVWERYLSADRETASLFNGVTELIVGAGREPPLRLRPSPLPASWVFATQRAEVERDGVAGVGRARLRLRQRQGPDGDQARRRGPSAKVTGAYVGNGRQHLDYDTTQEHAAEDTTSDLAFRGVLDGRSTAVWRGMINVDEGAQRTDAFQDCATCCFPSAPTPTRSRACRSRPTTSPARTPRRSPRSTPSSSST